MPFQAKSHHGTMEAKPPPPPARVSRFRRLLVRVSAVERLSAAGDGKDREKDDAASGGGGGGESDAGSVGLDSMVLSFMEDTAAVERPPRGRCNCFHGSHYEDSDDEEFDFLPSEFAPSPAPAGAGDTLEALKGLVQSASVAERNLLADAAKVAERCGRSGKNKAECRRAVADGLRALGYDAAVCKSRWERTSSYPAGEHEYIDVMGDAAAGGAGGGGEGKEVRLLVEVDFRSEFEVARSTKAYRAALQALPPLFVGTPDRLGRIVAVVAEAARHSLKKKGLHFPPWRKPEYMRAKWLSPHVRSTDKPPAPEPPTPVSTASFSGEFELRFDRKTKPEHAAVPGDSGEKITVVVSPWRPVDPEASKKVVTGLASVL